MTNELQWEDVAGEVVRLIKSADDTDFSQIKTYLGPVAELQGWKEGPLNAWHGGPRPLASIIAGGALGAGAGYGAGWLAEKLLPEHLQRKRLRKTLGIVGGLAGAAPGIAQTIHNASNGLTPLDNWPPKVASVLDEAEALLEDRYPDLSKSSAADGSAMSDFIPFVDRDAIGNVIWRSPGVPRELAAATDGLLAAASELRGGSNLVSPFDVARIAVGMGSGLVSGLVVGKTLGALAGLAPEDQKRLSQAGVIAGLVKSVVPMVFGR